MGFFDRLSKEQRVKSAIEKQVKRVMNKHRLSQDRFVALEKLREIGTDEAIFGLARRFSYVYDKTIEDEQEKEWVFATLVAFGEQAIEPVRRYAMGSETLSFPLRVLERVTSGERLLAIIDELLAREELGYTRDPSKKIQLLNWLAEWKGAPAREIARRVVPYLGDFDETVRFVAVDTLASQKHEETSRAPLLDALLRPEEESRRIKVSIAEVLSRLGWSVSDRKDQLSKLLALELPEYGMHQEKIVAKRKGKDGV
ncbi:MAG: hypothetical protein V2A73_18365 [Pseudomonadota bacterium]